MLKKTKIKIDAAVGTSLLTFVEIGTSVGIIENQKRNTQTTNNKVSVIKNDNLNTQSKNYSNYSKNTTLVQVEHLINQKANQQTAMFVTLSTRIKNKSQWNCKNIFYNVCWFSHKYCRLLCWTRNFSMIRCGNNWFYSISRCDFYYFIKFNNTTNNFISIFVRTLLI